MDQRRAEDWTCRECGHVIPEARAGVRCPTCREVMVPAHELERWSHDAVLGRVIGQKYAIIGVLGTGGFGTVYRAVQEPVGREVALKLVHSQHAQDPDLRARFFREARVVSRLSDPTVVTMFDYGDEPELGLYTVFELVDGETLRSFVKAGPQEPVWVCHVVLQLLGALREAHAMGMIHRDIKPANVMVVTRPDGEQRVRLLDFGIAKMLPGEDIEHSIKTQQGVVIGTPEFLSPEQARAKEQVDARSDIYSLGVLAYTLLAGANPFARTSVIDTILAHCSAPVPPLDPELQVPPDLEAVVRKALEKEPEDRYQTASEMHEALEAIYPRAVPSGLTPAPRNASTAVATGASLSVGAPESLPSAADRPFTGDPTHGVSQSLAEPIRARGLPKTAIIGVLVLLLLGGGAWLALDARDSGVISRPIPTEPEPATSETRPPPIETAAPSPPPAPAAAEPPPAEDPEPAPPEATAAAELEPEPEAAAPEPDEAAEPAPSRSPTERARRAARRRSPPPAAAEPAPTKTPPPAAPERSEQLSVPEF